MVVNGDDGVDDDDDFYWENQEQKKSKTRRNKGMRKGQGQNLLTGQIQPILPLCSAPTGHISPLGGDKSHLNAKASFTVSLITNRSRFASKDIK